MSDPFTIIVPPQYDAIRKQIEHEDNLIGQRVNWFVASQSFLFTAYAITIGNLQTGKTAPVMSQQRLLLLLVPIVAILTCTLAWTAIVGGFVAIRTLRHLHRSREQDASEVGLPPVQGYRLAQIFGEAGPLTLPLVFVAVWITLLVHALVCGLGPTM